MSVTGVLLSVGGCNCGTTPDCRGFGKSEAIAKARLAADEPEHARGRKMTATSRPMHWDEFIAEDKYPWGPAPNDLIGGRCFWFVHFGNDPGSFGGDVNVFVDAHTGEVLESFAGK